MHNHSRCSLNREPCEKSLTLIGYGFRARAYRRAPE
jgi:hypothetical protein